jgi:hypothetical protein
MFAALALAGAVAPPKISLSLEGMTSAYKLQESIIRDHDQGLTQNNGEKVMSRQDWTEKCAARRACAAGKTCTSGADADWVTTSSANCPFPVARGYDHQDKQVTVTTRVFLVDEEGTPKMQEIASQNAVNWNKRSTYLFKYDATDQAGNHAEQVVFALILNDDEAPFFQEQCQGANGETFAPAITVEAVSDWRLCELSSYDNMENLNTGSRINYEIEFLDRQHNEFSNVFARCLDTRLKTYTSWDVTAHVQGFTQKKMAWASYADAAKYMNPNGQGVEFVGKYLMTARTTDLAGVYGHNAVNNYRDIQQAILVRDNNKPVIYLAGSNPEITECRKEVNGQNVAGKVYVPTNDVCNDKLDTEALGWALPVTTTYRDTVQNKDVTCPLTCPIKASPNFVPKDSCPGLVKQMARRSDAQTLTYTCDDFNSNQAPTVTRTIKTLDTIAPTLTLKWDGQLLAGKDTDRVIVDNAKDCAHTSNLSVDNKLDQVQAEDSCDSSITSNSVQMSWGPRAFNCRVLGDYVRTYTVTDADNQKATKTRTFVVQDSTDPTIKIEPDNKNVIVEATRDAEYTDKGATCSDVIDGELSHAVEVSGEVVNMRIPATYTINYDCQDLSGNTAQTQTRTVIVKDTTAPELTLLGAKINYVEAGFPYIDAGATATDTLDGDITQYIWTDGDTVDQAKAFYQARSCQQILNMAKNTPKTLNNGMYYITSQVGTEYKRIQVNCIFQTASNKAYTFHVHTNGQKGNCATLGLKRANDAVINKYFQTVYPAQARLIGNLDDYMCTVDEAQGGTTAAGSVTASQIADAEQGKYVIIFNVEDKEGNPCKESTLASRKRTVVVKDTLPPVITLHLKNKLVHTGGTTVAGLPKNYGINHHTIGGHTDSKYPAQWNPAAYPKTAQVEPSAGYSGFGNPYMKDGPFMAETATTNGWLIGAVASAVAGVALLGFSARKSTVTSVPV